MDKALRNTLRNVVTHCRRLLEESVVELLQGHFGIHPDGKVEDVGHMRHLNEEDQQYREQILAHLEHIKASAFKPKEAIEQLVREVAFTHLNRFCAYKTMETRGLIRETVSRGLKSQGFLFYLADHPEDEKLWSSGKQDIAYRHFLEWLGETLSEEIGVLFSPHDPANRLFPPQRVIDQVLNLINNEELKGIWIEDETIGWIYQYFTPKELRDQSRKESQAPRNSYELAFRNQFYTPRYVVQFLTDNSLGRIWYEMHKGETALKEKCRYLVRRPNEVFLSLGDEVPKSISKAENSSQEELLKQSVYIPHRPKKDPRDIKVLDPACGSGHFLLYCFNILETIYEEAYEDPDLGPILKKDYFTLADLKKAVPSLILSHNLHGIDIDLRATQIAALALWLRAQRFYQEIGLENSDRPMITRSNIVCAEPMPGEQEFLEEFLVELQPKVLGQMVRVTFDKMRLAGEAGSLLKIEEEISEAVTEAKQQWLTRPKAEQLALWPEKKRPRAEQLMLFDVSGITDEEFWNEAESRVVEALDDYARHVANGKRLLRQLFVDDTAQGFAFVELCRKQFDVVLMNPPFGFPSKNCRINGKTNYRNAVSKNLAWGFTERALSLINVNGFLGAIVDRTIFQKSSYEDFRVDTINERTLDCYVDLGTGVLDEADVMTSCFTLKVEYNNIPTVFIDLRQERQTEKTSRLQMMISCLSLGNLSHQVYYRLASELLDIPFVSMSYWVSNKAIKEIFKQKSIGDLGFRVGGGLQCNDVFRFVRIWPEVPALGIQTQTWIPFYNGGPFSGYWLQLIQYVLWENDGLAIKDKIISELGDHPSRYVANEDMYFSAGIAGGKRGEYFDVHVLPAGMIFSNEGRAFQSDSFVSLAFLIAYLNSHFCQNLVNIFCGQHKGSDYLRKVPLPQPLLENSESIEKWSYRAVSVKRRWLQIDETGLEFTSPMNLVDDTFRKSGVKELSANLSSLINDDEKELQTIDQSIRCFLIEELGLDLVEEIENAGWTESPRPKDTIKGLSEGIKNSTTDIGLLISLFQYLVGIILGRWDIRIAQDSSLAPKLPGPFDPLPVCPPGMLLGPNGTPATSARIVSEEWLRARPDANNLPPEGKVKQLIIPDSEYPIEVDWDGILVDDPNHMDDIVRRVREVLEVLWKDRAENIEQGTCKILGINELRDYFRKPGNGGFWMEHVKRYSKSRRKAPIYWLLQSSKKNYALWLYYHRLDKDILFKALVNYVEPKLRLEESHIEQIRSQRVNAGISGREVKQLEKQLDQQEGFLSELRDFHDKLRRVADFHLEPDLNDGVVLNIAPLWELVPWKEAKKYWEELLAGKYEWSSISKQLRQKGIVK